MKALYLWMLLLLPSPFFADQNVNRDSRQVIGGREAHTQEFPSVIYLQTPTGSCTGTLISSTWVLTAAHCVVNEDGSIAQGQYNFERGYNTPGMYEVVRSAKQIIVHPEYDFSGVGFHNDAALLEMPHPFTKEPVKYTDFLSLEEERLLASSGTPAIAVGWGLMDENVNPDGLRAVQISVLSPEDCRITSPLLEAIVHDRILCGQSYQKGINSGDSGGPLFIKGSESNLLSSEWVQIGVASQSLSDEGVITSIYTRTASILGWMQDRKSVISDPTTREEITKIKERLGGTEERLTSIEEALKLLEKRVVALEEE